MLRSDITQLSVEFCLGVVECRFPDRNINDEESFTAVVVIPRLRSRIGELSFKHRGTICQVSVECRSSIGELSVTYRGGI